MYETCLEYEKCRLFRKYLRDQIPQPIAGSVTASLILFKHILWGVS